MSRADRIEKSDRARSRRKTVKQNLLDSGLITPEQSASLTTISQKAKLFEDAVNDPRKMQKTFWGKHHLGKSPNLRKQRFRKRRVLEKP